MKQKPDPETTSREDEGALLRMQTLLDETQRLSKVGGWEYEVASGQVTWTSETYRIHGVDRESYDPNNVAQDIAFYAPEDQSAIATAFQRALEHGESYDLEVRFHSADGVEKWVRTLGMAEELNGHIVRVFGNIMDITERKRAGKELQDRLRQLFHLERVQAMGEIASSLAHELNQPLAGILSNAQAVQHILDSPEPNRDQIRECVDDIVADDRRASGVVDRMRMMLKKGAPALAPLDVNKVVTDTMALVRVELVLRGIAVRIKLAEGLPRIEGDSMQLEQVLLNLILNAEQAMQDQETETRKITVCTTLDAPNRVTVSVRDTGVGIDPAEADHIFDAFHTSKPGGLGMGLPICRSIITAHHGHIWAEAHPEGGTQVSFTLPTESAETEKESEKNKM